MLIPPSPTARWLLLTLIITSLRQSIPAVWKAATRTRYKSQSHDLGPCAHTAGLAHSERVINWEERILLEVVQAMRDEGTSCRSTVATGGGRKLSISPADAVVFSILAFARHDSDKVHQILVFAKARGNLAKLGIVVSDYNRLRMFQHGIHVIHHQS